MSKKKKKRRLEASHPSVSSQLMDQIVNVKFWEESEFLQKVKTAPYTANDSPQLRLLRAREQKI